MAGNSLAGIGSAIGNKYGDSFSTEQQTSQAAIRKGLENIPVWGPIIAAASGAVDAIGNITGTNLSNIDKGAAKKAGIGGSATFNNVMNMLPGNSMIWGIMGQRSNAYKMSDQAEELSSGYTGTIENMRAAEGVANKRLLFGQGRANAYIDQQKRNEQILHQLNETNTMRKQSNYAQDLANQNINRYAGENYLGYRLGRNGMQLMSIEQAKKIIALRKEVDNSIEKFQNGGVVGIDTNILPEGALHARKNHLADVNPDLEDATKKGIPVMASDGGEIGEQVAEIEHSEIIFRLEVTKRLEELMKDGSDEAAIEAGKLIAEELIENTQDNVGMITEEVQNGE